MGSTPCLPTILNGVFYRLFNEQVLTLSEPIRTARRESRHVVLVMKNYNLRVLNLVNVSLTA